MEYAASRLGIYIIQIYSRMQYLCLMISYSILYKASQVLIPEYNAKNRSKVNIAELRMPEYLVALDVCSAL